MAVDSCHIRPPGVAASSLTVAHVIHSLGAGGAEAVLVELARAAPSAGLRLIVVGLSDPQSGTGVHHSVVPQLRKLGATVYEMHAARYNPMLVVTLAKIFRKESVDVVHTHMKHADVVGGAAADLPICRRCRPYMSSMSPHPRCTSYGSGLRCSRADACPAR